MASKLKLMKFLHETHGQEIVTSRCPATRPAALYSMELRAYVAEVYPPRRRLSVAMKLDDASNSPRPVKINHRARNQAPATPLAG